MVWWGAKAYAVVHDVLTDSAGDSESNFALTEIADSFPIVDFNQSMSAIIVVGPGVIDCEPSSREAG